MRSDPRLSRTRGTTTTHTYDRADRLTSAGGLAVTVDAAGNLVARGADTFTYDAANRLVTAHVGSLTETNTYDGDGNRVSRTSGSTMTPYVLDVNGRLPVVLSDGVRRYVWGHGLLSAVSGSTPVIVHADRLGSVRALTDASGAATATYRTDAYGIPTSSTGSSTQPFGFSGALVDATGLVDLRARMYDPTTGRFMSRDCWPGSVTLPMSLDRYVYVRDNPATLRDPSGRCLPGALAGAATSAVASGPLAPAGAAGGAVAGFVICVAAGVAVGLVAWLAVGPKPAPPPSAPQTYNPRVEQRDPGEDRLGCGRSAWVKGLCATVIAAVVARLVTGVNEFGDLAREDRGVMDRLPTPGKSRVLVQPAPR